MSTPDFRSFRFYDNEEYQNSPPPEEILERKEIERTMRRSRPRFGNLALPVYDDTPYTQNDVADYLMRFIRVEEAQDHLGGIDGEEIEDINHLRQEAKGRFKLLLKKDEEALTFVEKALVTEIRDE